MDELNAKRLSFTLSRIPGDATTFLDIGGSDGVFKIMLEYWGYTVAMIDIDPKTNDAIKANAIHLPFKDNSFDAVVALEIIEHLNDVELPLATAEMKRVAKKYVVVSVPNKEKPLLGDHRQWFDRARLLGLFDGVQRSRCYGFGAKLNYQGEPLQRLAGRISTKLPCVINYVRRYRRWLIGVFTVYPSNITERRFS